MSIYIYKYIYAITPGRESARKTVRDRNSRRRLKNKKTPGGGEFPPDAFSYSLTKLFVFLRPHRRRNINNPMRERDGRRSYVWEWETVCVFVCASIGERAAVWYPTLCSSVQHSGWISFYFFYFSPFNWSVPVLSIVRSCKSSVREPYIFFRSLSPYLHAL